MDFEQLSPELKERVLAAKSAEELIALANEQGIELSDEQLESINGGWMVGDVCVGVACMEDYGYDYY